MNICVECKFIKPNTFADTKFHECRHPDCRHPVSGYAQTCVEMRKAKAPCGLGGLKWELGTVGQTIPRPVGPANTSFGVFQK